MKLRRYVGAAGFGVLVGLALFAVEGLAALRSSAVGLDFATQGPFQAVFEAVRPTLPELLVRVAVVYGAAFALLGLLAEFLVRLLGVTGAWKRALAWALEVVALAALWAAHAAVLHPALFDDVGFLRGPLTWLSLGVRPEQVAWGAALFGALHLVVFSRRRTWLVVLAVPAAVAVLVTAGHFVLQALAPSPGRGPLVVLIGVDALRADRLQGHGVLPALEGVRDGATEFSSAWTSLAQTEPAWRSLLTARWPFATGVRTPLTPEAAWASLPTMTQVFSTHGWRTHFETDCSRFNYQSANSGFLERRQPPRGALNFALEKLRFRFAGVAGANALGAWWLPELFDNRALAGLYDADGYARRLAQRLVSLEGPALFAFHATATHFPGDPGYPYYRLRLGPEVPLEQRVRMHFSPIDKGGQARGGSTAQAEALYDELLAQADAQVGTLVDALKAAGRWDDALVVVFSDHGESFHADHPELAGATPVHGARLTEEENRVVLLVKLPGQKQGHQVKPLVRLVDVGPTVLEAAHLPPLDGADGRSFFPLLQGRPIVAEPVYLETGFTHASPQAFDPEHLSLAPRSFEAYVVRDGGVLEMSAAAYQAALAEKDLGVFDGEHWLVRSPLVDGGVRTRCTGDCDGLGAWLDGLDAGRPGRP